MSNNRTLITECGNVCWIRLRVLSYNPSVPQYPRHVGGYLWKFRQMISTAVHITDSAGFSAARCVFVS